MSTHMPSYNREDGFLNRLITILNYYFDTRKDFKITVTKEHNLENWTEDYHINAVTTETEYRMNKLKEEIISLRQYISVLEKSNKIIENQTKIKNPGWTPKFSQFKKHE